MADYFRLSRNTRCNLDSNEAGKDDNNRASQGEATAPVDEYRNIEAASRLYVEGKNTRSSGMNGEAIVDHEPDGLADYQKVIWRFQGRPIESGRRQLPVYKLIVVWET
ncbi:hypothetical protein RRG08_029389 [Elysia crispata]|uniref:Uncharacterized protein n=1 Tax=Elysia crispata TaxID=231223 RepID=A0AAE1B7B0_9GAST|nr:hypothetical protein RRG08_029389 [Elysia crispata]